MTHNLTAPSWLRTIAMTLPLVTAGCSLVLDASPVQCVGDADCEFLGSQFACEVNVCVETDEVATPKMDVGSATGSGDSEGTGTDAPDDGQDSESGAETEAETGASSDTGVEGPCDPVSSYSWAESIAVVRNACDLPSAVSGTVLTEGANEVEVQSPITPLPFDICLYGEPRSTLWIGDNGYLTLGDSPPAALQSDVGVPHSLGEAGVPGLGVVAFWDALQTSANGVCVAVEGSEPDRILWVTWDKVCFEDGSGDCNPDSGSDLTFSVGFEEATGGILIGYLDMNGEGAFDERAQGQTSITGITNTGPRGCTADQCNTSGLCEDDSPCNYTEVAATTIRPLNTIEFTAQ